MSINLENLYVFISREEYFVYGQITSCNLDKEIVMVRLMSSTDIKEAYHLVHLSDLFMIEGSSNPIGAVFFSNEKDLMDYVDLLEEEDDEEIEVIKKY